MIIARNDDIGLQIHTRDGKYTIVWTNHETEKYKSLAGALARFCSILLLEYYKL